MKFYITDILYSNGGEKMCSTNHLAEVVIERICLERLSRELQPISKIKNTNRDSVSLLDRYNSLIGRLERNRSCLGNKLKLFSRMSYTNHSKLKTMSTESISLKGKG